MNNLMLQLFNKIEIAIYEVRALVILGLILLLAELIKHRLNFRALVTTTASRNLKVNCLSYVTNVLLLAGPIGALVAWTCLLPFQFSLVIFRQSRFDHISPIIVVISALVCMDFAGYCLHRLWHTKPLWPFHELHHSDEQMNWFTLHRFHPVNQAVGTALLLGSLALVGFPNWSIATAGFIVTYYSYFIHANLPWTLGPFKKLLVSPAMHRWHHSRTQAGMRSNYAGMFSFIDVLFGTFYCPGPCSASLGVDDAQSYSFFAQIIKPFSLLAAASIGRRKTIARERN